MTYGSSCGNSSILMAPPERNKKPLKIVICDDDKLFRDSLRRAIETGLELPHIVDTYENSDQALDAIRKNGADLMFLDIKMRTLDEGLAYLPRFKEILPDLAIVMTSGFTEFKTVRQAMQLGASDYIPKGFTNDDLFHTINLCLERRKLLQDRAKSSFEILGEQRKRTLIGNSPAMVELRRKIEKLRTSPFNVLIKAETGCGKEVVSRLLRGMNSDGSLQPFVAVDSSTVQSSIAESILFGHEKGAFTGAEKQQKGLFEEADGGIIYFDELSNMTLEIQAKLLRVIQEKEFSRMGSTRVISSDFRVVSATNRDLAEMCKKGEFRADLYERLNIIPLEIPPLRERVQDIAELARYFLKIHTQQESPSRILTEDALEVLSRYRWPGNVRELSNVIAYCLTFSDNAAIDVGDLPERIFHKQNDVKGNFYERLQEFEKQVLDEAYLKQGKNISQMAQALGMDRSHLHAKLKSYGIHGIRAQ